MDQRKAFIEEYRRGLFSVTELSARYQISRKTGYKLIARVDEEGMAGLHDHSRGAIV